MYLYNLKVENPCLYYVLFLSKQSGGLHLYLGVAGSDRSIKGSDIIICTSPDKLEDR